jgi:dipeptidyl aminopeptidase/acylaminoacyl peptidase
MTFDDMMAMKRLGETAVSPDGKWLAYSVTTVDLAQNTKTPELWLQAIAGGEPMKLAVGQAGDSDPEFSADEKRILWISGREDGQQIWLADFDTATGATSNAKKLTAIATGADSPKWSPDGHSVVFLSAVYPDCPAITTADFATGNQCNADRDKALADSKVKAQIWTQLLYRHWNRYTGDKRSHLFLVSVESGAMRDLNPGDAHDVPPFSLDDSSCGCDFSPDSKELAFTENPDPVPAISISAQIYTLDLTDPNAKPVKVSTSAGGNFNPAYSPDGKYLAWRSEARAGYESDKFRLVVYDREARTARDLLSKPMTCCRRPGSPSFDPEVSYFDLYDLWADEFVWAADSQAIYLTAAELGSEPISSVGINGKITPLISLNDGEFGGLLPAAEGRILVATKQTVSQPSEVVALLLSQAESTNTEASNAAGEFGPSGPRSVATRSVTHLNDALLAQLDLPKMESFWFTAQDGTKVQGFLIRPPGFDPAKKYPLKFLIHGGPQGAWGDDWSYRWNAELFAANGYVVVMINPRGSTGYGQAFVDGVNGDWGGKPFTDLMTGLDYAEQHYPFIDKTRECALGASYGGYMANWVLGHTDRFKCIVSHDGMFDAESAFGSTEEDWFNIWEFKGHPWDYYGKPDAENPFRKWSPSLYAKNFKTPTLVIHSQLDYRLDVSEGFQLFDTLQLLGVPSKMLYFPDEGHWVLKLQNSQLWWKTVNDWVDEWTGGPGNRQ